jgi:hypothetical protein
MWIYELHGIYLPGDEIAIIVLYRMFQEELHNGIPNVHFEQ